MAIYVDVLATAPFWMLHRASVCKKVAPSQNRTEEEAAVWKMASRAPEVDV